MSRRGGAIKGTKGRFTFANAGDDSATHENHTHGNREGVDAWRRGTGEGLGVGL
jgi:hypothetical protein